MSSSVDVVVVGAGHNGLTCAAYLAKAGLSVMVLEARHIIGGACVTEELWPGFKNSRASYVCGLFRPRVVRELGLKLPLIPRRPSSFTPDASGGLVLGLNKSYDFEQIARYSRRDAERYHEFERVVSRLAELVDPILDIDAGDVTQASNLWALSRAAGGLLMAGKDALGMFSMLMGSARNQLTNWFETEPLRSTLATDALIGTFAGPSSPGTGYVLVHHMMGGGSWSYVRGGMGTISDQLRQACEQRGVRILTNCKVRSIDPSKQAVTLDDGKVFEFKKALVSNLNPASTMQMVNEQVPQEFMRELGAIDFRSPVVKINLALDSLPTFSKSNDGVSRHSGTIHIGASSLDELDASFEAAQRGQLPEKPMIEMTIPSALDDTLAPSGKHVCSLFVQHVPASASNDFWHHNRDTFADRCIKAVEQWSPGFGSRILHREVLAPPDLEQVFGLTGGNIFHGAMTLDRLLFNRPVTSYFHSLGSSYATPFKNIFLCSAGTHPGGGVMGACGRNAAIAMLRRIVK